MVIHVSGKNGLYNYVSDNKSTPNRDSTSMVLSQR